MAKRRLDPAPHESETLDVQRDEKRLEASFERGAQSAQTPFRVTESTSGMERAQRLGHRIVSVSSVFSSDVRGGDPVQRKASEAEDLKTLKKSKQKAPEPRLKLQDYLEGRRLGRQGS